MEPAGTFYDSEQLQTILDQVFTLIREQRPAEADAILQEHNLVEFVCGPV